MKVFTVNEQNELSPVMIMDFQRRTVQAKMRGRSFHTNIADAQLYLAEQEEGLAYGISHLIKWFPQQQLLARIPGNRVYYTVDKINFSTGVVVLSYFGDRCTTTLHITSFYISPGHRLPLYKAKDFYTTETIMPTRFLGAGTQPVHALPSSSGRGI